MEKKHNPKLAALLQLRKMVEELINDDFQSDKMPKLMALKVKMTPEAPMAEEMLDESPEHEMAEGEMPSLSEAIKSAAESSDSELGTDAMSPEEEEVCPICGEMDCECEDKKPVVKAVAIKASTVESPQVAKLKKLLGK